MKLSQSFYDRAYSVFRTFYRIIFKILFRCEIRGIEHVPRIGGAILAVNHSSALDPLLGGAPIPRKMWYLGRASLVKNKLFDFILACQHFIPITRGAADIKAAKRIIGLIKSGEIVLMFPEGTRSVDGSPGPGKEGVGMFVRHAEADVIPCYISGARRALPKGAVFPRPRKIRIVYGPLIKYDEFRNFPGTRDGFRQISQKIMGRIAELKRNLENNCSTG
jgi:1-acyl-sn-glycerol-3-phosphate acyltransferase